MLRYFLIIGRIVILIVVFLGFIGLLVDELGGIMKESWEESTKSRKDNYEVRDSKLSRIINKLKEDNNK